VKIKSQPHRCGTLKLASPRFTMLNSPSPRINPLANTMIGVSLRPFHLLHHRLIRPPIARANVNDGVLYMPTYHISEPQPSKA